MRLILASTSPRRKDLLALLQLPFEVVEPVFVEEVRVDAKPEAQARRFAEGKAASCAAKFPDRLVVGSDTLIAVDGAVLGKPVDLADARAMLRRLWGREHLIHTAAALRRVEDGIADSAVETVRVWMRKFSEEELDAYLRTEESLGKAGAYSIQGHGARLVERIAGDYPAAVGLPLRRLAVLLQRHGVSVPVEVDRLYAERPYPNWATFTS